MEKLLVFGYTMEMGGAEKALCDTLNYLANDYEIDLYLLEKKGSLLESIPKNVNVYQIKTNIFKYILFRFISFFRKLVINKIANKKDYKWAWGYMEGRSGTWVYDIKKDIKKYAWIHNDVERFDIGISLREARETYRGVTRVICVSKDARDSFIRKYGVNPEKVLVIYNYIDEEIIKKKALEYQVKNDVFTFVNVAKMRDQKRQDRIVKAGIYLKSKGYKFQIQLIGDGPNLESIKKMVLDNGVDDCVKVLGLKTNPYPYIKAADYFVLSSYMEGYGIVIKEALCLKTKVITTDVVGPREILMDGKYGVIVPNTDEDIIRIMEDVMKNKEKYTYLDKEIRKYHGDNEKIMADTRNLFKI